MLSYNWGSTSQFQVSIWTQHTQIRLPFQLFCNQHWTIFYDTPSFYYHTFAFSCTKWKDSSNYQTRTKCAVVQIKFIVLFKSAQFMRVNFTTILGCEKRIILSEKITCKELIQFWCIFRYGICHKIVTTEPSTFEWKSPSFVWATPKKLQCMFLNWKVFGYYFFKEPFNWMQCCKL